MLALQLSLLPLQQLLSQHLVNGSSSRDLLSRWKQPDAARDS
jgi:hypothetical protein